MIEILSRVVFVVMFLSALGVIVLVLLQHGKGADMGTGFGAGASGSLFGATGSANFLSRTTKFLAGIFFVATLALSYFATNRPKVGGSVMQNIPVQTTPAPAKTAPPGEADKAPATADKPAEIPK